MVTESAETIEKALDTQIIEVIGALKAGRLVSDKNKWPWHVSAVGGLLPYYALAVQAAVSPPAIKAESRPCHPCSASLWKCLFNYMRGAMSLHVAPSEFKGTIAFLLGELSRCKSGDIFNRDGNNIFFEQQAVLDYLDRIQSNVSKAALLDARRIVALLFSWTEACAFTDHTNYEECHGRYQSPYGDSWYIYEFHDLKDSHACALSSITIPFSSAEVIFQWEGPNQHLEVFNNCLNAHTLLCGNPKAAIVIIDGIKMANIIDACDILKKQITKMVNWVESQSFDTQVRIAVWEWNRRLKVMGSNPDWKYFTSLHYPSTFNAPVCSFSDLECYVMEDILK